MPVHAVQSGQCISMPCANALYVELDSGPTLDAAVGRAYEGSRVVLGVVDEAGRGLCMSAA